MNEKIKRIMNAVIERLSIDPKQNILTTNEINDFNTIAEIINKTLEYNNYRIEHYLSLNNLTQLEKDKLEIQKTHSHTDLKTIEILKPQIVASNIQVLSKIKNIYYKYESIIKVELD